MLSCRYGHQSLPTVRTVKYGKKKKKKAAIFTYLTIQFLKSEETSVFPIPINLRQGVSKSLHL